MMPAEPRAPAPVVDLPRVRALLAELDAHLAAHPEIAERTAAFLAGELPAVAEESTLETLSVAVRLDPETLARLDRFVEALRDAQPGVRFKRPDAIRLLLHRGFEAWEAGRGLERTPVAVYQPQPPAPPKRQPKDPEAWAAALAELRRLQGLGLSQRATATALNEAGHRGRQGGRWRQSAVSAELGRLAAEED